MQNFCIHTYIILKYFKILKLLEIIVKYTNNRFYLLDYNKMTRYYIVVRKILIISGYKIVHKDIFIKLHLQVSLTEKERAFTLHEIQI